MLSIWWDCKGIHRTSNSAVYCKQLVELEETISEKGPKWVNRSGLTHLQQCVPNYWSLFGGDLASRIQPRSCTKGLSFISKFTKLLEWKNVSYNDDLKWNLVKFFAFKNQKFYKCRITKLPERWQTVIKQNERCFDKLQISSLRISIYQTFFNCVKKIK